MPQPLMTSFRDVDAAKAPGELLHYLLEISESGFMRERSLGRLARSGIAPGGMVADLGCGVGTDTLMLARHVAIGGGRVVGLDLSRAMLGFARARPEVAGLPVEFWEGDVARLPFEDRLLDAVWMERVLVHAEKPVTALTEMRRVLRPGGVAVVCEADYRTLVVDAEDPKVSERLSTAFAASMRNPWIGSALPRLARDAGFSGIRLEADPALSPSFEFASTAQRWREVLAELVERGDVAEERAEAWWQARQAAAERGVMVSAITFFVAFATR